jgi:hypothetical protein
MGSKRGSSGKKVIAPAQQLSFLVLQTVAAGGAGTFHRKGLISKPTLSLELALRSKDFSIKSQTLSGICKTIAEII